MDETTVLTDKLIPHQLPTTLFPRSNLMQLFKKAQAKQLLVIDGPSGFGKTCAAAQWLQHTSSQAMWISLDEYDNSLPLFYKLFCSALLNTQKDNQQLTDLINSPEFITNPVEYTMLALTMSNSQEQPLTIIFDNFNVVTNPIILTSLPFVFKRLSVETKIIILSRKPLSHHFYRNYNQSNYTSISSQNLVFSPSEIVNYYQVKGKSLTSLKAQEIVDETQGWPIIVDLLATNLTTDLFQIREKLSQFIEENIWQSLTKGAQDFLLRLSVTDEINNDICQLLTGPKACKKYFTSLTKDGLIIPTNITGTYKMSQPVKKFLTNKFKSQTEISKRASYLQLSRYYTRKGALFKAQQAAINSGDKSSIIDSLLQSETFQYKNTSIDTFVETVLEFLTKNIPQEVFKQETIFHAIPAWYYFLTGEADKLFPHLDILHANLKSISDKHPTFKTKVEHILSLDPRQSLLSKLKFNSFTPLTMANEKLLTVSRTLKLPFLHRSLHDYSDLAKSTFDCQTDLSLLKRQNNPPTNILIAIKAGLALEQNNIASATPFMYHDYAQLTTDTPDELYFSLSMLMLQLHYVQRNQEAFDLVKKSLQFWLKQPDRQDYLTNFSAYSSRLEIWQGKQKNAKQWLGQTHMENDRPIKMAQLFQHFTTIRAYILLNKNHQALTLAEKIRIHAIVFQRFSDEMEASILMAIIYWQLGNTKPATDLLENILSKSQPYGFIRMFADEGKALLPLLKLIKNRTSQTKSQSKKTSHYFNEIYNATLKVAKEQTGILPHASLTKVKLSKQQLLMIQLLGQGHKFSEIVTLTKLSINTIRAHVTIAYRKLGVNNRADAVLKAKELNLL